MGSDLNMESRNRGPKASAMVLTLEQNMEDLQARHSSVIAEKSRLETQARQDARTIVQLARGRSRARSAIDSVANILEGYRDPEVASSSKLHRYAEVLREGLNV